MAPPSPRSASPRTARAPAPKSERPSPDLKVARSPGPARRTIGGISTTLALSLFALCLGLAALHAVLVENQATLDDLLEQNQQRYGRIDQLQAEIAYLDSPEGLAEQASLAGLVPAAELVVLNPVGPNRLAPPDADPFDLWSSGWTPPSPPTASGGPDRGKPAG